MHRTRTRRPKTRLRIQTLEDRLAPAQLGGPHGGGCGCGLCAFGAPPDDAPEAHPIYAEGTSPD